jgi:hypothetical protein
LTSSTKRMMSGDGRDSVPRFRCQGSGVRCQKKETENLKPASILKP